MLLGALIDLGLDVKVLRRELAKLKLDEFEISARRDQRQAITGIKFDVLVREPHCSLLTPHPAHHGRTCREIKQLIESSKLGHDVKRRAAGAFRRLAEAEGKIHGMAPEKVHFHEVGAVDSIVDIVGAVVALEMMGVDKAYSSAFNLGSGMVKTSHGAFPVPAPATAKLAEGVPAYGSDTAAELTTPTGAAILTTLADGFGPMPPMRVGPVGYGAGEMDFRDTPNLLRVFVGETDGSCGQDSVDVIETNIDDMDPRLCGHVLDRLFEEGALDAWIAPVIMKKSRPAVTLSAICGPPVTDRLCGLILEETTTLGVRVTRADRRILERRMETVETRFGQVRVKLGILGGRAIKASPEYDDVKAAAKRHKVPARYVVEEALRALDNSAGKRPKRR
jgi:uncharacterized protein (TIGR00299 family) protein